MFLLVLSVVDLCDYRSERGGESGEGLSCPTPDSGPFNDVEFWKNLVRMSRQFAASANRHFEFQKRRQLFIHTHNETLSIIAACVCDPDGVRVVPNKFCRE